MGLEQAVFVVLTSLAVSLATELISWLLVYRTANYRRIKDELDRGSKRLEAFKQQAGKKEKKEKRLEDNVKTSTREFTASKMKANMIAGALNLIVVNRLLASLEGVAVATLPFQPPVFFAKYVTHRGLEGNDLTECSALFIYILSTLFWKFNLAQACGWHPSRAAERLMRAQQTMNVEKYK